MLHRGQGRQQLGHYGAAVQRAAAVTHAVARDQHTRFDLLEAVQHGLGAHVRGADAPDAANADGGQKGHHRLGDVGQVGGYPITGLHPLRAQVQGQRGHLLLQLRPGQFTGVALAQAVLVVTDDGRQAGSGGRRHMAHDLACIVHLCASKPAGVRHGHTVTHPCVGGRRLQVKVVPGALPKGIQVGGGPAPQRIVVVKGQAALTRQPLPVQGDLGNIGGLHGRHDGMKRRATSTRANPESGVWVNQTV